MSALFLGAGHLAILASSLPGLIALALASERQGELLLGRPLPPARRLLARTVGTLLLALSLGGAIAWFETGVGATLWLGWLSIAALGLVFALPRWSPQPAVRRPAGGAGVASVAFGPRRSIALALLVVTAGGFAALLWQARSQAPEHDGVIRGAAGPWTFTLNEAERAAPEVMAMGVPMKTFHLRFCEECDTGIRQVMLKVNRPRNPRASGMAFIGQRWERKAEIPLPRTLRADSELWLTVVGKDGSVYQHAWRMDQVSPATVAWFEQQRRSDAND